jgi:hypothetical protein
MPGLRRIRHAEAEDPLMVKAATCSEVFGGHCRHWGLTDAAHALVHAQVRRINEVAELDKAANRFMSGSSSTSIADDGPRLEALLHDEGYRVVPADRATPS